MDNIEREFIGCLPTLSDVALQFVSLTRELSTPKRSYANLLLSDPTLSTRIFSYINLVLNSGNSSYLSINKGISLMGLHKFKNLVVTFSLFPVFHKADCIDLFKYSLLTGYQCKDIASQFNLINPNDAFLLGFLHDIGKIAIKNKFGEKYSLMLDGLEDTTDENIVKHEKEVFGYSHSDISEFVCKSWNLPLILYDAIKNHHAPLDAMLPQAASIIYLSDMLAHKSNRTSDENQKVFQYLRLSKSDLASYMVGYERKLQPYFEVLGM